MLTVEELETEAGPVQCDGLPEKSRGAKRYGRELVTAGAKYSDGISAPRKVSNPYLRRFPCEFPVFETFFRAD